MIIRVSIEQLDGTDHHVLYEFPNHLDLPLRSPDGFGAPSVLEYFDRKKVLDLEIEALGKAISSQLLRAIERENLVRLAVPAPPEARS